MRTSLRYRLATIASAFVLGLSALPALADDPPKAPDAVSALETLAKNLGYTVTESGTTFSIVVAAKYTYTITFQTSTDNATLYLSMNLTTLSVDELKQVDTKGLLETSDLGSQFFTFHNNNDANKTEGVYLITFMPVTAATPTILRSALDHLVSRADASDALWDKTLWKAATN